MRHGGRRRSIAFAGVWIVAICCSGWAQEIKHRFIAIDEARDSLVYIDQNNPSSNFAVSITKSRDIQLVGSNRVMLSNLAGFAEYDLTTRQRVRDIRPQGVSGVQSARRLPNGNTLLAAEGISVWVVNDAGTRIRTVSIANMSTFRVMRHTSRNTWLVGSGNQMVETDTSGTVLKRVTVSGANSLYKAVRTGDGSYYASTGYLGTIVKLDSAGVVKKTFGGKPGPTGYQYNFFADFGVLPNGHVVTTNWLGHGYNDGANGTGLIEYDTSGAIVWSWMDHARVSSLHAVIVLDGCDASVLNDERTGTLAPVGSVNAGPRKTTSRLSIGDAMGGRYAGPEGIFDCLGRARTVDNPEPFRPFPAGITVPRRDS